MPTIVCLSGKRGHGKSTVAEYLCKGWGFQEISFAAPLKKACQDIFGFTDAQVHDPAEKERMDPFWKVTPRQVLQVCGTELFRDRLSELLPSTKQVWVKALIRQLLTFPDDARVCCADVRFGDEWNVMQAMGAKMVKIVRPGYIANAAFANHPSETALDDVVVFAPDTILWNDTSVADLCGQISPLVQKWCAEDTTTITVPENLF